MSEHTHIRGIPASYAQCVGCKERLVQMMDADEQERALEAAVVEAAMAEFDALAENSDRPDVDAKMRAVVDACAALREFRKGAKGG